MTPNDIAGTDPAGAERNGQIRQDREMAEAKQVLDKRIEEMRAEAVAPAAAAAAAAATIEENRRGSAEGMKKAITRTDSDQARFEEASGADANAQRIADNEKRKQRRHVRRQQ